MVNIILMVIGVGLMIGGVVITIVEAPKAKDDLDSLETDWPFALILNEKLSHKDYLDYKTSIIVKYYWKTVTMTLSGAGIIFWSCMLLKGAFLK